MKRFVCIVCLLAMLLSACSAQEQTPTLSEEDYNINVFELSFETRMLSNHSVGNEWSFTYVYGNEIITSGYRYCLKQGQITCLPIDVEVREQDEIDDVGTGRLEVSICDGGSGKVEVTVTETNGMFTGNSAVWEITCTAKLVGRE